MWEVVVMTTWLGTAFPLCGSSPRAGCRTCIKGVGPHCHLTPCDISIACLTLEEQGECPYGSDGSVGLAGTATPQLNGTSHSRRDTMGMNWYLQGDRAHGNHCVGSETAIPEETDINWRLRRGWEQLLYRTKDSHAGLKSRPKAEPMM